MKSKNISVISNYSGDPLNALSGFSIFQFVSSQGFRPSLWTLPNDFLNVDGVTVCPAAKSFLERNCGLKGDEPIRLTKENHKAVMKESDTFISDLSTVDISNYQYFGPSGHYFLLDFVPCSQKKILLGGSTDSDTVMPSKYKAKSNYYLDHCERAKQINPICSLTDKDVWNTLAAKSSIIEDIEEEFANEDYIFCYVDSMNSGKYKAVKSFISDANIYTMVALGKHNLLQDELAQLQLIQDWELEDIIYLLQRSSFVVTDSHNAVLLCTVLGKPFTFLSSNDTYDQSFTKALSHINLQKNAVNVNSFHQFADLYPVNCNTMSNRSMGQRVEKLAVEAKGQLSNFLCTGQPSDVDFDVIVAHDEPKKISQIIEYKIQNLLFPNDTPMGQDERKMFYRGEGLKYIKSGINPHWSLSNNFVDCFTYFNSLSVRKWKRFTGSNKFYLHLLIKGKFSIDFIGHWVEGQISKEKTTLQERLNEIRKLNIGDVAKRDFIIKEILGSTKKKEMFPPQYFETKDVTEIVLEVPYKDASVAGFILHATPYCEIFDGWYSTYVVEDELNQVDISICTTTFNKEKYITHNIELFKNDILLNPRSGGMENLADHLYINVVDNGRSDVVKACEDDHISIYPNPNVGGAGGFSRGMMETMRLAEEGKFNATHVIFMDDDVKIMPEALKRTYALLQLLKDEYKSHFISGAMLFMEQPHIQHEDIGYFSQELNSCNQTKPRLDMSSWDNIIINEEDFSMENQYAAWWYCCVPMQFVRKDNLSVPLFFRGDDVEFALRNKAKIISMNGICIWHMGFANKFVASVEHYLVHRNSLFTQAVSGINQGCDFMVRIRKIFFEELRRFHYISAEFMLDCIDDFLKGPEYFATANSEKLLKEHSAKNEKMYPLEILGLSVNMDKVYEYQSLNEIDHDLFIKTSNGHELPDYLLKEDGVIPEIAYTCFESPGRQFLYKNFVAVNPIARTGAIRTMDRDRYYLLISRYQKLTDEYNVRRVELTKEYRAYAKIFYSAEFWNKYLDRNGADNR